LITTTQPGLPAGLSPDAAARRLHRQEAQEIHLLADLRHQREHYERRR
jgi:hypothetical protein